MHSHLLTNPPSCRKSTSWICSFCRHTFFARLPCQVRRRAKTPCSVCTALHVLLPGRGDNKKWTRLEIFFFFLPLRCITLPRCFQQEAVGLREGCVEWMGKVKVSFLHFLCYRHPCNRCGVGLLLSPPLRRIRFLHFGAL